MLKAKYKKFTQKRFKCANRACSQKVVSKNARVTRYAVYAYKLAANRAHLTLLCELVVCMPSTYEVVRYFTLLTKFEILHKKVASGAVFMRVSKNKHVKLNFRILSCEQGSMRLKTVYVRLNAMYILVDSKAKKRCKVLCFNGLCGFLKKHVKRALLADRSLARKRVSYV